jgi:hypothetical protein
VDIDNSPRLQVVVGPDLEWAPTGATREMIRDWTQKRGESARDYSAVLVWCVKKAGHSVLIGAVVAAASQRANPMEECAEHSVTGRILGPYAVVICEQPIHCSARSSRIFCSSAGPVSPAPTIR